MITDPEVQLLAALAEGLKGEYHVGGDLGTAMRRLRTLVGLR